MFTHFSSFHLLVACPQSPTGRVDGEGAVVNVGQVDKVTGCKSRWKREGGVLLCVLVEDP